MIALCISNKILPPYSFQYKQRIRKLLEGFSIIKIFWMVAYSFSVSLIARQSNLELYRSHAVNETVNNKLTNC